VDTTFARVDMGQAALERIEAYASEHDEDVETVRRTVPGIKDLPAGAKRLISLEECDIVLALGQVGPEEIDRQCAHEASLGLQQAQLATDTHVLEVFVHTNEVAEDEKGRLRWLAENRAREHALNAMWMLFEPERMRELAGTGQREGFHDAGPIEEPPDPPKEGSP
jgi:riboflavin synthase